MLSSRYIIMKSCSDFDRQHNGGVLSASSELLGQGEHGGGFTDLARCMDDEVALLVDDALHPGESL